MSEIKNFNKFVNAMFAKVPFSGLYDFTDKNYNITSYISYMLNRTQAMFKYEGLPETISERILELYLQINGFACFADYKDDIYIFYGGLGGVPDVYYQPTICTVANPALKFNKNLVIGKECEIVKNDSLYIGLMPMFSRYATLLAESELSLNIAIINSRIVELVTAPDDRTKIAAEKFLEDIIDGKTGVIADNVFLDGLKSQPYGQSANGNKITQIIESIQYNKAGLFNELGLNANYNMKREALSSAESQLNNDALLPLIDNMLECRQRDLKKVNEKFGLDIKVSLNSSWEDNKQEIEIEHKELENSTVTNDKEVIENHENS